MKCYRPLGLLNPARTCVEDSNLVVSCGKCYACLANRRRAWLFRLQCESMRSKPFFVTLTYDDNDGYFDGLVHKSHIKIFVDNLRLYHHFRYYFIGEYGTHTFRPHYHAVLFFSNPCLVSYKISELIHDVWNHGFVAVSDINYRRLNYVLHYHTRPKNPLPHLKTFSLFSNHLGDNFIYNVDGSVKLSLVDYLKNAKLPIIQDFEGNNYVIPRYYRKKLQEMGLIPKNERFVELSTRFDDYIATFGKPYEVREDFKDSIFTDLQRISDMRISKYNNQDKFL